MAVWLRPFEPADEHAAIAAHEAFAAENFSFLLGYDPAMSWSDWLASVERQRLGLDVPPGWVRSSILAAEVEGALVGRVSVRFALNEFLIREGGHIGYGVLAEFRHRGYATEMLRQAIDLARRDGLSPLLLVCNETNLASASIIERCGGVLENRSVAKDGTPIRRYWI